MRAYRAVFIYLIVSTIYIIFSDKILALFIDSVDFLTEIQTYKGLVFVISSGALLYFLIRQDYKVIYEANESLEKAINSYRIVFDKTPVPSYIIDARDFSFLRVNEAAQRKFGRTVEEYLTSNVLDFVVGLDREDMVRLADVLSDSGYLELYLDSKNKAGEIIKQHAFCQSIVYQEKQAIYIMTLDIRSIREPEIILMDRMIETLEKERTQVSSEIHDGIKQYFGLMNGLLKSYIAKHEGLPDVKRINTLIEVSDKGIQESRRLSHALNPLLQNHDDIKLLVKNLVDNLNYMNTIHFEATFNLKQKYKLDVVLNLYRIVQEGSRNVMTHAKAKNCHISFEENEKALYLRIIDDGKGFNTEFLSKSLDSLGLISMRTRADKIGGLFSLRSEPGEGTRIQVKLPITDAVLQ